MKTWPKRIYAVDPGTAALIVGGAQLMMNQNKGDGGGGASSGPDTRPWQIRQQGTLTPEQQAAYDAMLPGGARPTERRKTPIKPVTPVTPVGGNDKNIAVTGTPTGMPRDSGGPVSPFSAPTGPQYRDPNAPVIAKTANPNVPEYTLESEEEFAARQAAWDKANIAPSVQGPAATAPIDESELSISGLDDATRGRISTAQQEILAGTKSSQDLLKSVTESNINENRDSAIRSKVDQIMSEYGSQAVSGSKQLAAFGSDAGKFQTRIAENRDSAIANAVAGTQLEADKIALAGASGLGDVELGTSQLGMQASMQNAEMTQAFNVRQGELDLQRESINADLASKDADRVQAARLANAQLEAQQRQLDLDKISQVRAFENIAFQGGYYDPNDPTQSNPGYDSASNPAPPSNPFTQFTVADRNRNARPTSDRSDFGSIVQSD